MGSPSLPLSAPMRRSWLSSPGCPTVRRPSAQRTREFANSKLEGELASLEGAPLPAGVPMGPPTLEVPSVEVEHSLQITLSRIL